MKRRTPEGSASVEKSSRLLSAPQKRRFPLTGFTLIEVLIAFFLIGMMLLLFQVALGSIPLIKYARNEDLALKIAQSEMETLRADGYALLPASGSFSNSSLASLPSGSGTITVSDFNDKTKEVSATVTWQEQNASATSTLTLTTLITQTGGL